LDLQANAGCAVPPAARDARRVASELSEMLAVVVAPAILLSGFSLFVR
jgi:hypothetical protein